ncbi:MAG: hypothetical protein R3C58_02105 [Parvularculaceae bacterium]
MPDDIAETPAISGAVMLFIAPITTPSAAWTSAISPCRRPRLLPAPLRRRGGKVWFNPHVA